MAAKNSRGRADPLTSSERDRLAARAGAPDPYTAEMALRFAPERIRHDDPADGRRRRAQRQRVAGVGSSRADDIAPVQQPTLAESFAAVGALLHRS